MAYIAQRQDGGRDSRGRSTFANAGQTMMSPRVDLDQTGVSNASGGSPMYSSAYPYPGANSKVDKVYPGLQMIPKNLFQHHNNTNCCVDASASRVQKTVT